MREDGRVEFHTVNAVLLDQITEADVLGWMAAKLRELREATKLPIHNIQAQANFQLFASQKYYEAEWTIHGGSEVAMTHKTLASAVEDLRESLLDNPRKKAETKRDQARRLNEEADTLERVANGSK